MLIQAAGAIRVMQRDVAALTTCVSECQSNLQELHAAQFSQGKLAPSPHTSTLRSMDQWMHRESDDRLWNDVLVSPEKDVVLRSPPSPPKSALGILKASELSTSFDMALFTHDYEEAWTLLQTLTRSEAKDLVSKCLRVTWIHKVLVCVCEVVIMV